MSSLTTSSAWIALQEHYEHIKTYSIRDAFDEDNDRFNKFSLLFSDILFDFSKNRIDENTLILLCNLAKHAQLEAKIQAMFSGVEINTTEHRAVLHIALRNRSNRPILVNGQNVMPDVNRVLAQMRSFCDSVRSGEWKGFTGKNNHRHRQHRNRGVKPWPKNGFCRFKTLQRSESKSPLCFKY